MMETIGTQEEPEIAYEMARRLLETEDNWVGVMLRVSCALRENGGPAARRLTFIAHGLINETRAGLAKGVIGVVLSHPARLPADTLVTEMAEALNTQRTSIVSQHVLPFEINTAANI
ncbi:hypothetical protein [Rhizobium sp. ZPR3]|uniref:Uncharacterized protein n=2 Tax=unclassified Rhizobium TaxID=2613769 RepID=A0AAU7SS13_9HYPH